MYPQVNNARAVMSLDGMWNFCLDDGTAEEKDWGRQFPAEKSEQLYVPASYNDQREDARFRSFVGTAWYEQKFTLPSFWKGQRLVLRFDAVTHNAAVWINGIKIMEHRGGFLPFEADVTDLVHPGETFSVVVSADNRIGHDTLPVGNEGGTAFFGSDNAQVPAVRQAKLWRGKVNLPNFDFFNYAGIQRHVRLYTTPVSYIDDIVITPDFTEDTEGNVTGNITWSAVLASLNSDALNQKVKIEILDEKNQVVASACEMPGKQIEDAGPDPLTRYFHGNSEKFNRTSVNGRLSIQNAHLWEPWPGTPYLYHARITFGEDEYTEDFGIRTVKVSGTEFLLNGKPFYFKGFGKHEDFYISGRGTSDLLNGKDVSLLHWIGANSFRTSHYPYAEEMYRLCDREGIVIIDEAPAVGIGMGKEADPYKTLPIRKYHEEVILEMIRRDRNHPSVVMWSMGNEPDTENWPESAYTYWKNLYDVAHAADNQNRPVTFVCCQNDYTRDLVTRTMDVVCINRYYGWYNLSGDMDAAVYAWNQELDFWEKMNKPVMCTEYGADTLNGLHGTTAEMFTEEFQANYYKRIDEEVFDRWDFFVGEQCWCFADFGTLQGVMRPDGNRKGVFTRERRPKLAAYYLKDRWEKIPNAGYKKQIGDEDGTDRKE